MRKCGGIPIDRANVKKFPVFAAEYIKKQDKIAFLISPEGTRKLNPNWKRGFYFIAQEAGVPIVPGYLDFRTKRGGVLPTFFPTGDYEKDLAELEKNYYGMRGKIQLGRQAIRFPGMVGGEGEEREEGVGRRGLDEGMKR